MREKKKKPDRSDFDDLIKSKIKKEKESRPRINWEERKKIWLSNIEKLYTDINSWFEPFGGDVKIEYKNIPLEEEYIGSYSVEEIKIKIGTEYVTITPRGTIIIGGFGRVDMTGLDGEAMFLLLPEKEGKGNSIKNCSWHVATRSSKYNPLYNPLPLNKNTFAEVLKSIMRK